MKRRTFIAALGGAAAAWPVVALGQQATPVPLVGVLGSTSLRTVEKLMTAFREGLSETGYVEGKSIAFDYHWADGQYDRLPALAGELLRRDVAAIFATSSASTLAAKAATTTVPIVFTMGGDAMSRGIVASISRPTGNITGVNFFASTLGAKQIELLHELLPKARTVAVLLNPKNSGSDIQITNAEQAARAFGQKLEVLTASTAAEIEAAFNALSRQRSDALLVGGDAFLTDQQDQIVAPAGRYRIPTIYPLRDFVSAGGLISYGTSQMDAYRQAGIYVGRVLNGDKPANLPIMQAAKVELVINIKTAEALGLTVPPTLLARADEVIE